MKAVALFLLRIVTGLYLLAWSAVKLTNTAQSIEISGKLYFGLLDNPVLQHALGALGGVLGLFVILGFLRSFSYLVQALVLALGVGALAKTFAAPADVASGVEAAIALTPYLALFVAGLVPLLAKADDILSLDSFLAWAERRLARDEMAVPAVTAATAAAAIAVEETALAAPADEEPAYEEPVAEEPAAHEAAIEEPVEEIVEAPQEDATPLEEAVAEAAAEERADEELVVETSAPEPDAVAPEAAAPEIVDVHAEAHEAAEPAVETVTEAYDAEVPRETATVVEDHLAAVEREAHRHEAHAPTVH